jgi:hypothetical protein
VNHWSAWQIEESGIKIHVSPKAETIVHGLTKGYLIPTLRAADEPLLGPEGGRLVVWYDVSEITQRPDRSDNFVLAYDRYEIKGEALRREIGADEDDAPTEAEFVQMVRKRAARGDQGALQMLSRLENEPVPVEEAPAETPEEPDPEEDRAIPDTRDEPPPPPDDGQPAETVRRSVLVAAGTPVVNRATRRRRGNGHQADEAEPVLAGPE